LAIIELKLARFRGALQALAPETLRAYAAD
jgi:hypothetical protein